MARAARARWGSDEQGVPLIWFGPLCGFVGLLATLILLLVQGRSFGYALGAGATFGLAYALTSAVHRSWLAGRRARGPQRW